MPAGPSKLCCGGRLDFILLHTALFWFLLLKHGHAPYLVSYILKQLLMRVESSEIQMGEAALKKTKP
jgi:hypothetical protein